MSDGTGTSGLGQTALASQTINVSGAVYRLAGPVLASSAINVAARVGEAAAARTIGLTNSSPDAYTERLNATPGTSAAGFSATGSVTGLAAGASSTALGLTLSTAVAGSFSGTANLGLVSSGVGTTGAADAVLAGQTIALSGRVYTPAIAQVGTGTVDFGIVHVCDVVAARNVSVVNAAAVAAPNDTLSGTLGGATARFTATGTIAGLLAQTSDAHSFQLGLNTGAAGTLQRQRDRDFCESQRRDGRPGTRRSARRLDRAGQ